jgi:uroporphyrinogen-III synthase
MPASLQGQHILITRARDEADRAGAAFRALGAVPVIAPTIETCPITETAPLLTALQDLQPLDWLVITSPTAARIWVSMVPAAAVTVRVGVIGEATAAILEQAGHPISLISPRALGVDLADAIIAQGGGQRVLLPRSDIAIAGLPERLRKAGYETIHHDLYRTVSRQWTAAEAAEAATVAAVTLMSPSAAIGLSEQPGIDSWLPAAKLVAIGPTTADAVLARFGRVDAVAEPLSLQGLVAATVAALAKS